MDTYIATLVTSNQTWGRLLVGDYDYDYDYWVYENV